MTFSIPLTFWGQSCGPRNGTLFPFMDTEERQVLPNPNSADVRATLVCLSYMSVKTEYAGFP